MQKYNTNCVLTDGRGIAAKSDGGVDSPSDLYLKPEEPRVFSFAFVPCGDDVGEQIEVLLHLLTVQCQWSQGAQSLVLGT